MAKDLKISKNPDFLHIQVGGSIQPEGVQQFFSQISETARNANLKKMLVDTLAVDGSLTTMQRFEYGNMLAEHFRGLQVALVVNEALRAPDSFGETVAVNRGANIRLFTNLVDAQCWLGIPMVGQKGTEGI